MKKIRLNVGKIIVHYRGHPTRYFIVLNTLKKFEKKKMFLISLLSFIQTDGYRVKHAIGQSANLPFLPGFLLDPLLKKSKRSVVFFHEENAVLEFANFGIQQFKDEFNFFRANASDGKKYGCFYFPCAIAFEGDKQINTSIPTNRASAIVTWLQQILDGSYKIVKSQEQLRVLLEQQGKVVFGVDQQKPPKHIGNHDFYLVNSTIFAKIGLNVTKGYYLYRSIDRQLLPFNDKQKIEDSILTDPRLFDISEKPFFGGYVINTKLDKVSEEQIKIMEKLALKYNDTMSFGPIVGSNALLFLKAGKTEGLDAPYFMVFNTSSLLQGRWLLYKPEDDIMNFDKVSAFVDKIISGKLPFTIISEDIPEDSDAPVKHLVGSTFADVVFKNDTDTLVTFVAEHCKFCPRLEILLTELAQLYANTNVTICKINGADNDVPNIVPDYDSYPTIMLFKQGEKDKHPVKYKGSYRVKDISRFIHENANSSPEPLPFVSDDIEDKISKLYHDYLDYKNPEKQKQNETNQQNEEQNQTTTTTQESEQPSTPITDKDASQTQEEVSTQKAEL